ncbi:BREX-2 system adenine-specific DNA-methyltransferase PglX [Sinomonas sp. B1-1]|uniref:BREX-2 system adenine-specific DNA-methyltransferase PglX n=1 Tax=Sinomonas sp. B1-1 TaxID=3141454 RepID=UPI003D280B45
MTAGPELTAELRKLVLEVEDDLRERLAGDAANDARWRREHADALKAERTSSAWEAWRDDRITQSAVAWVLTTVFVRFCEDNALVSGVWITGPGPKRQEALDAELDYFRRNPEHTHRDWTLQAVEHLKALPATRGLVESHSPLWQVQPSGAMAKKVLDYWRETAPDGSRLRDLTDLQLSTRFLGDLYQDLSEYAKKTYALLQTPEFVEEFILDETLTPALKERALEGFKIIDPTCGSGHFLLGAFHRMLDAWATHAPAMESRMRIQKALDSINGVDINPFAVAISKFRLTAAALSAEGLTSLEQAPGYDYHLAAGDSLLHGQNQREFRFDGFDADAHLSGFAYATEDLDLLKKILRPGQYDVVVGNPPYITVKDKTLNAAYRKIYATCKGTYALTVPFMERFFGLAKHGGDGQPAGWTGQITSNSFMKREFGSKIIEDFLSRQDLRLVADTSGAYIPGHGTPTVIITGRHQRPVGSAVRAVLGVRGEPGRPNDPEKGLVWQAIVNNVNNPGHEDSWISVVDLDRTLLNKHPWSLSGGGASNLLEQLDRQAKRQVRDGVIRIGFYGDSHADEAFFIPADYAERVGLPPAHAPLATRGELVRDWTAQFSEAAFLPYDENFEIDEVAALGSAISAFWPLKTTLWARRLFSGATYKEEGRSWLAWHQLPRDAGCSPMAITFAFVATHNHFVLDRGGKVFNRSAPVIKLPEGATEDEHLALLGVLNSSTACFWLKQNSHNKGNGGIGGGIGDEDWEPRYEFTGTTLQDFPLPHSLPLGRAQILDALALNRMEASPDDQARAGAPTAEAIVRARKDYATLSAQMIAQQEELDWEVYRLYGLTDETLTYSGSIPEIALGERAFEIALARKLAAGEEDTAWFERHGSTPITEIPARWPEDYRALVQRRLDLIESNPNIRLLEKPEYKRRWATEPWEKQQERALRGWLLDRLEDRKYWFDNHGRPTPKSIGQLADTIARDAELVSVLELWAETKDVNVVKALTALLSDEAVPYLAAHRLKDSGLRTREAWVRTWELQRDEDEGKDVGKIPVPPKYATADFRKTSYWQARGKLDVPKERFVLYPDAGRSTDPTLLLGWAGWNHAEQFLALATIQDQRQSEGEGAEKLVPLVAGMNELLFWVQQWHQDVDPLYGTSMAAFCAEQLDQRMAALGVAADQLTAWRPAPTGRGRKPKTTAVKEDS